MAFGGEIKMSFSFFVNNKISRWNSGYQKVSFKSSMLKSCEDQKNVIIFTPHSFNEPRNIAFYSELCSEAVP